MFLNGEEILRALARGERILGDSFLLLVNAGHEGVEFTLPPERFGAEWTCELRTDGDPGSDARTPGRPVDVTSRSLVLLRRTQA